MASKFRDDDRDTPSEEPSTRRNRRDSFTESDIKELLAKTVEVVDKDRDERVVLRRERAKIEQARERSQKDLVDRVEKLTSHVSDLYDRDAWDVADIKRLREEFARGMRELEERDADILAEIKKDRKAREDLVDERKLERAEMSARISTVKWIVGAASVVGPAIVWALSHIK